MSDYRKSQLPVFIYKSCYTKYTIEVLKAYKGELASTVTVVDLFGIKDYKVDEQLKVINDNKINDGVIMYDRNKPEGFGKTDETHLFILNDVPPTNNEAYKGAYIGHCMEQNAYNLNEPEKDDKFGVSLKKIIEVFGKDEYTSFIDEYVLGVYGKNDARTLLEAAKDGGIRREDAEKIKVGMTFGETVAIIGKPQRDVGYGVFIFEWDINTGEVLSVAYNTVSDENNETNPSQENKERNLGAHNVEIKYVVYD